MKKIWITQIAFLLVLVFGALLLGLEIFGHMDPDRVILFAVITGTGLLGNCACTFWRVHGRLAGKK